MQRLSLDTEYKNPEQLVTLFKNSKFLIDGNYELEEKGYDPEVLLESAHDIALSTATNFLSTKIEYIKVKLDSGITEARHETIHPVRWVDTVKNGYWCRLFYCIENYPKNALLLRESSGHIKDTESLIKAAAQPVPSLGQLITKFIFGGR